MIRRIALGLVLVAVAAVLAVYVPSQYRIGRVYEPRALAPPIPSDAASIERGRWLAEGLAQCGFCHGDDLGGEVVADLPFFGRLYAPNLTTGAGGLAAEYTDVDWVRALRHGIDRWGRSLAAMPSEQLRVLSDADLAAIVAYLRSVPPIDRTSPGRRIGSFARLTLVTGLAPELLAAERIDHGAPAPAPVHRGATAAYGSYLVSVGLCRACHHDDLSGGLHPLALPGEPPPADLRAEGPLGQWSEAEFVRAMRTGVTPDGRALDAAFMAWPRFAQLGDVELSAIWRYLREPTAPR